MSYLIRYETKKGGSGMQTVATNTQAKNILIIKHLRGLSARVEKKGIVIGECYKQDGKWMWYIDQDA